MIEIHKDSLGNLEEFFDAVEKHERRESNGSDASPTT